MPHDHGVSPVVSLVGGAHGVRARARRTGGTMTKQFTPAEVATAAHIVIVIAETIRDLGAIPSGHLYAHLANQLELATFTAIINKLKEVGFVKEENHVLIWIGPAKS